ncbi:MAG: hypothetical protein WBF53_16585 [Litorimonas sp.]
MRAQVPEEFLPTRIDDRNAVIVPYTTNVLFPKLGPLAVKRYVRVVAAILQEFSALVKAAELDKDTGEKPGRRPKNAGRFDIEAVTRNPVLVNPHRSWQANYMDFLNDFQDFNRSHLIGDDGRIDGGLVNANGVGADPAVVNPGAGGRITQPGIAEVITQPGGFSRSTMLGGTGLRTVARTDAFRTHLLDDSNRTTDKTVVVTADGRVIDEQLSTHEIMSRRMEIRSLSESNTGQPGLSMKAVKAQQKAQVAILKEATLYSWLAKPSDLAEDLYNAGGLKLDRKFFFDDAVIEAATIEARAKTLMEILGSVVEKRLEELGVQHRDYTRKAVAKARELISMALQVCETFKIDIEPIPALYEKDPEFQDLLRKYVITRMDTKLPIGDPLTPSPDSSEVTRSREWAFQRRERLEIKMGTPTLRGPVAAEGVTPNSERTTAFTQTRETVSGFETSRTRSEDRTRSDTGLNSSTFRDALDSMTEAGQISDESFQNNSVLSSALRERRRERISSVIDSVSQSNETRRYSASRRSETSTQSYVTRGKDDQFSSTEVRFQVACEANVEVHLDDVDIAWCPRSTSPFIYLHQLAREARERAVRNYDQMNGVVDPTRPTMNFDTHTFSWEQPIMGDRNYQRQTFSRAVEGNILAAEDGDGAWAVDPINSKVEFRNGRGKDYDWLDRGNWDDLEVWHDYFVEGPTLDANNVVSGAACLETTDPEYWNKGFMKYTIALRRPTAESVAALARWEADKKEAAAEREAVAVRAKQYGELKQREFIARFEDSLELRKEVFASLMREVFAGKPRRYASFYEETIRSAIDWTRASMTFEQPELETLPYPEYPPTHFMNVSNVRMVFPIHRSGEDAFFDSLASADAYHKDAADGVREFVGQYREVLNSAPGGVMEPLDSYSRTMVLGQHIEAVLSNHAFAE